MNKTISFIGAGNMGEALIRGLLLADLFPGEKIMASEPRRERRREIAEELRVKVTASNREAIAFGDIVVLCIKPQNLPSLTDDLRDAIKPGKLVISILAGVPTALIEKLLGIPVPVVRVMPNTPALIQAGVAAINAGTFAGEEDLIETEKILGAVGRVVRLPENLMDVVTAISGSGPAYVYLFTEALYEAARELGIKKELAEILARETVIGSAKLLEKLPESPASLRAKVTSPGGTTEAALRVFESGDFIPLIKEAVKAAWKRGEEMGKDLMRLIPPSRD